MRIEQICIILSHMGIEKIMNWVYYLLKKRKQPDAVNRPQAWLWLAAGINIRHIHYHCATLRGTGMKKHLKLGTSTKAIQSAFLPFQCTIESIGTGTRFRFRVFDENENVLSRGGLESKDLRPVWLPNNYQHSKSAAGTKGFHLQPWDFTLL